MCKIAGMVYHKMEESSSEGSESEDESFNDNEPMSSSPNLDRLAKTYVQFLAAQRAILKDLYPKSTPTNGEFMVLIGERDKVLSNNIKIDFRQFPLSTCMPIFNRRQSKCSFGCLRRIFHLQQLGTRKMVFNKNL
jgi:hypothetical protein